MIEELTGRHLVGVTRAIKGMDSVEAQTDALLQSGVDERHIWQLDLYEVPDVVAAIRPGNDVLVVPFLGVLGKYRSALLAGIADKGATLYDLEEYGELDVSQAPTFHLINQACHMAQSAPGRAASSGGGRPDKLSKEEEAEVLAAYIGTRYKTIASICDAFKVSPTWLHNRFGGRDKARETYGKK